MCALVLSLRRIPINAPGGGSASLGSADAPTYSVSVSDEQAQAARKAYSDKKEASHIKTEIGASTAVDSNNPNAAVRNRDVPIANASETSALAMLNTRSPAFDPMSPSSRGQMSPQQESAEEEMLRRASTRGKRRESPNYTQHDPVPQYLAAPPVNSQGRPGPPPQQGPPPTYGNFPQPPAQQQPRLQSRGNGAQPPQVAQHMGYSGRSQSPAAGPRYEYPPGQQQPKPPSRGGPTQQPPPQQQAGRGTPPRAAPPPNAPSYNGNGYSS